MCFLGNLGRVDFINDYEYDLFIRPDTCNPRYRCEKYLPTILGIETLEGIHHKGVVPREVEGPLEEETNEEGEESTSKKLIEIMLKQRKSYQ